MRSIVAALTLGLVLSLALVMAVQWSVARATIAAMMEDSLLEELIQDADELAAMVAWRDDGSPAFVVEHFDPVFLQPQSGRYFELRSSSRPPLRSPSLGGRQLSLPDPLPGRSASGRRLDDGRKLLYVTRGYQRAEREFTVVVASELVSIEHQLGLFIVRYTLLSGVMFVLLVVLQAWIVRRTLAPVNAASAELAQVQRGERSELSEVAPAEVAPLIRAINRLLAAQADRLRRSREAVGNLSHALKTPLTRLTQLAEDEALRSSPGLQREMLEQLHVVGKRIDRELRQARLAGAGSVESVVPAAEFAGLVDSLRKLYRERSLDIEALVAPAARFPGDREDLLELGGNLLDNACKWARSRVRVVVADAAGMQLTVEDDGPGCSDADLARLGRRGVRLDESTDGHGLGLAIVRDIVADCQGRIDFDRSPDLGGLRVRVAIPAG